MKRERSFGGLESKIMGLMRDLMQGPEATLSLRPGKIPFGGAGIVSIMSTHPITSLAKFYRSLFFCLTPNWSVTKCSQPNDYIQTL
jgi:hypothetical protein